MTGEQLTGLIEDWHGRVAHRMQERYHVARQQRDEGEMMCIRAERLILDEHLLAMLGALEFIRLLQQRPYMDYLPDNCRLQRLDAQHVNTKSAAAQLPRT